MRTTWAKPFCSRIPFSPFWQLHRMAYAMWSLVQFHWNLLELHWFIPGVNLIFPKYYWCNRNAELKIPQLRSKVIFLLFCSKLIDYCYHPWIFVVTNFSFHYQLEEVEYFQEYQNKTIVQLSLVEWNPWNLVNDYFRSHQSIYLKLIGFKPKLPSYWNRC